MHEHAKLAYDFSGDAAKALLDIFLAALPVALLYGLILLVLCVVAIVFMHKRRLYTREARLWNVLAKLHYPLWLLVFGLCGFAFGFIASIKSSCDKVIDEKLQPALTGMVPPIQQKIIDSLPPELAEKPMTGQAIYDHVIDNVFDSKELERAAKEAEGWLEQVSLGIQHAAQRYIAEVAIDTAIKRAGEKVGMAGEDVEFTLETFKAIDFSEQADEIAGKATGVAKKQISAFANGMHLQVLTYGGILLLLLFIEPLVYYKVVLPRKAKALKAAAAKHLEAENPATGN